jgi:hypothetical protein
VLLLEKRYPWTEENLTTWKARELDSFLKVKSELMPALRAWRQRHPEWTGDSAGRDMPSPDGMLAEERLLVYVRSKFAARLNMLMTMEAHPGDFGQHEDTEQQPEGNREGA